MKQESYCKKKTESRFFRFEYSVSTFLSP